ncbi:MAG: glycosyltransferase family 2 protein [bacterium]|nr:glycosyltransferase family 2 protein [bacterium]
MSPMDLNINANEHTGFRLSSVYQLAADSGNGNGSENDRYFLEHTGTGAKVETDLIGKQLLEQLPASARELIRRFDDTAFYVSPKLIGYYLLVFRKSGVIEGVEEEKRVTGRRNAPEPGITGAPGISVVIVTFNGEKFIRKNLESLYRQTLPAQEILLVDNASGDGSLEEMEKEFTDIRVIRNRKNYHYAQAVNIGVKAASCDLVIILNQDIVLAEDFIENLYRRYDTERDKEKIAGVVPQMRFSQLPAFINGIGNFLTEKNWGSDNYFGVVDIGQFDRLDYVGSACFGAIMVTKQAWRMVGPLDRTYKSFYEDSDWSMRAHLKGLNLLAAPKALVYHAFGGSYPSGLKLTFVAKNRMRFVLKHLKGRVRTKFFKKYLKQDIKNCLSFMRRKSYKNMFCYVKAYLKLLLEIPNILFHKMRKDKSSVEVLEAFFVKGTPYVAFSNDSLNPLITRHVIRSYYYYTGIEGFQYPTEPILG